MSGYWDQPGKWRVAAWNYESAARGRLAAPGEASVFVVDSTIRSIVTSEAGSAPTADDLVDIVAALADAGVTETVFNVVHGGEPSELTIEAARKVRAANIPIKTSTEMHVGPDDWKHFIEFGMSLNLDSVQWAYGAGAHKPGYTGTSTAMDIMEEGVAYMTERGQATALAYNVMRDDRPEYIVEFFKRAARLPMGSLRLYDTTTSMSPDGMRWLVSQIKDALPVDAPPLVVHTHNSWGLAAASTIGAVLGGADGVDLVVNGLGTKGGHTPMAETLVALESLYGVKTGVQLNKLTALSQLVSERIGLPLPRVMPGVGPDFFLVEQAGLVMQAYKERDNGQEYDVPWAPSLVGQQRKIVWGRNTLKTPALVYVLRQCGFEPTPERVEQARATITAALAERTIYPIWLEEADVIELLRQTPALTD
jgi:isopropylmalate/homocitrate/citramalate synthase